MALNQIISRRQTVMDAGGANANIGGRINVYAPGTTTRITTYQDSGLTIQNTNPILLDVGKASVWLTVDCDITIEDRDGNIIDSEFGLNPETITGEADYGLIPNGSFEIDEDADGTPDGWTRTDETGSNNDLDTTENTDGQQSMRFTSTGSGGGNIVTTDFFPVNGTDDLTVQGDLRSTVVDVRNIVRVEWYDSGQVSISDSDIYDNASSNPTSWTSQTLTASPPGTARFAKLRLIGCDPSDATSGTTYFDNWRVFYPQVASGIFDNITISGNDIITTNTNGDLNLNPNGTGSIVGIGDLDLTGDIIVSGNVDGRDVAADGTKLDGIESGATGDQTGAEIKTLYEGEANTNAFTDAEQSKLTGIESGATADQTITAGTGLSGGGTGDVSLAVDLSELVSDSNARVGTDEFIMLDGGADRRVSINNYRAPITTDTNGRTIADSDMNEIITYTGSGGHTWSFNTGVGSAGQAVVICNDGSADGPLIGGTATVQSASGNLRVQQNGVAVAIQAQTNVWNVSGDLVS